MRRRIAVVGDTLSSGGEVLPYVQQQGFTFHGQKAALIGEQAYCATCRSAGAIAKSGGPRRLGYMSSREAALDGDIVLCKCPKPPHIVAKLALESWCDDIDYSGSTSKSVGSLYALAATRTTATYDERFTLHDVDGNPLSETCYTVRLPSGDLVHGITDNSGCTARYATDGCQDITVYLGHRGDTAL
jgi:hypothetical protein